MAARVSSPRTSDFHHPAYGLKAQECQSRSSVAPRSSSTSFSQHGRTTSHSRNGEHPSTSTRPLEIAVCGGGIGGLALGIGLANQQKKGANIRFIIYERSSSFKEIGAGVGVGPNASQALSLLGMGDEFRELVKGTHNSSDAGTYYTWRWGTKCKIAENGGEELIVRTPCPYEFGHTTVHRARFLDMMVDKLPDGVAQFGKSLRTYTLDSTGRPALHFADGTTASADVLIACDGIKSNVRPVMLADVLPKQLKPRFTGTTVYRSLSPMDEIVKKIGDKARQSTMYLGKDKHILTFPLQGGKVLNVVVFSSDRTTCHPEWTEDEWIVPSSRKEMMEGWEDWSEDCQAILGTVQSTDKWALHELHDLPTHVRGRVALLGDAATATLPHQGQGAAMAIESGFVMSCLLASPHITHENVDVALQVFNALRHERTTGVKRTSNELGRIMELSDPSIGADKEKLKDDLTTRYDWIWGWDGKKEVETGLEMIAQKVTSG